MAGRPLRSLPQPGKQALVRGGTLLQIDPPLSNETGVDLSGLCLRRAVEGGKVMDEILDDHFALGRGDLGALRSPAILASPSFSAHNNYTG